MALRVFILDIDCCSKVSYSVAIDRAQFLIQATILFCSLRYLLKQAMSVDPNTYMSRHRSDGFEIFRSELITTRLTAQQYKACQCSPHNHRYDNLDSTCLQLVAASSNESRVLFIHQ